MLRAENMVGVYKLLLKVIGTEGSKKQQMVKIQD